METWNSKLYDEKHQFVSQYGENLIEVLNPIYGENILDLGCGTGDLASQLAEKGAIVTGIDPSGDMIQKALDKYPVLDFHIQSAEEMVFSEKFDAVFSNAVFHWVKDPELALENIYNSLKTGGRFVTEFGGKDNVKMLTQSLMDTLSEFGYHENAKKEIWFFPSPAEFSVMLENAGFTIKWIWYFDRPTELNSTESGVQDWFRMFGEPFFDKVAEKDIVEILKVTTEKYKSENIVKGKLYADYKRLRVWVEKL